MSTRPPRPPAIRTSGRTGISSFGNAARGAGDLNGRRPQWAARGKAHPRVLRRICGSSTSCSVRGDVVTKKEMTEIFSVMLLAWPNAEMFKGGVAKLGPTIELWTDCLSDVDFWLGQQAVIRLCRECKFPPSIAEFKEKADNVQQEIRSRIDLEWNEIKFSRLLDKSPQEWYQRLPTNSDVKAVIDALGGMEKFATKGEGSWNYYEFRDMYEKLMRKEVPGAVARLTSGKKKELSP
nr:MAG TPA: Loader and inhibitor of phage G40P [Caudoviricetes sp.]